MGRQELIGDGDNQLIPHYKVGEENLVYESHRRKNKGGEHQKRTGKMLTQHTGLPPKPRADMGGKPKPLGKPKQRGGR